MALLSATFDGPDGVFASSSAFWDNSDLGVSENPDWFAESGTMDRLSGTGHTTSSVFRMWTRRTDLAFTTVEMDVRFNGWTSGTESWHGVNLWLNRRLRTPSDGSRINDGPQQEGYVVDFLNRDGKLYLQKKVGDVYYILKQDVWQPVAGTWYRWGGRVIDNGNGTSTIQVLVDGQVIQQVTDDGSVGGSRLLGGRTGLRSDYSDMTVDNLTITEGSGMAYRDVVVADAPLAYWRLGEASGTVAADERAVQAGTYVNAPTLAEPGLLTGDANTAVTFNGTSQRVDVGDLKIGAQPDAAVELWFKATTTAVDQWMYAEGSTAANNPLFGVILQGGKARVFWRNDVGTALDFQSPLAYNDGARHQVVVTKVGTAVRIHVDGAEVASGTTPGGAITFNTSTIGALRRAAVGQWYAGTLDEVAVGNVALTAAQVAEHYQAGSTAPDTTPPAVPTGLAATPGNAQVALSWTANTEADLAGYRLYRDGVGVYDGVAATFTDATVTNGTAYSYTVSAYDTAGNESAKSTAVQATPTAPTDTTPPSVPSGLTAAPGDAQVSIDWSDNVEGDLAGYRLYRDGVQVFDGVASTYLDATAVNGTTYSYAVSAYDTTGNQSAQSVAVQATPTDPDPPPAAPTGLAATVEPRSVTLRWDPNTEPDLAGYRLRRDSTEIYNGALASFTDSTALPGETVSYTVSAYDTAGNESAPSAPAAATTNSWRLRGPAAAGGLLSALSLDTPDGPVTLLAPGTRGVSNAEGFAGMATRVITTARAGRHGSINRTRHRQDRQITWEGTLQGGGNPDQCWWEYQQIARALASAQDEDRELHYTLGRGVPLFARVRLEELSAPIEVGPNIIKYQATMRAQDPRGYSAVEHVQQTGPLFREDQPVGTADFPLVWPVTFPPLTTGRLSVHNDGTVGTPPIIELDGYLLNPVVQLADRRLVFVGEIAEGDTLTIDTDERTVTLNGTANRRGLLDSVRSRWFELPPYPAVIELLPQAFAGQGGLRVRFRDATQ